MLLNRRFPLVAASARREQRVRRKPAKSRSESFCDLRAYKDPRRVQGSGHQISCTAAHEPISRFDGILERIASGDQAANQAAEQEAGGTPHFSWFGGHDSAEAEAPAQLS